MLFFGHSRYAMRTASPDKMQPCWLLHSRRITLALALACPEHLASHKKTAEKTKTNIITPVRRYKQGVGGIRLLQGDIRQVRR